jgi:polysaccharide export outer membrane protein
MQRAIAGLFVLLCVFVVSGCADRPHAVSAAMASTVSVNAPYLLRPSDQVRVQVYGETNVTGDYTVDGEGYISVPLAGRVKAAGATTQQLERSIASRLNRGMLKDAGVNVQVSSYSPFYIRGEVKKPGEFPYRPGLTVADAVALAGGYTYRADESRIYVRPAGGTGERELTRNDAASVSPGDNIRVPERFL